MGCNCKNFEIGISLVILVVTMVFWKTVWGSWVVVIAAVLLLLHALKCKNVGDCEMPKESKSSKKKSKRKK